VQTSPTKRNSASALLSHYDASDPEVQKLFMQWVQERDQLRLQAVINITRGVSLVEKSQAH
jgi:hypothetical protein